MIDTGFLLSTMSKPTWLAAFDHVVLKTPWDLLEKPDNYLNAIDNWRKDRNLAIVRDRIVGLAEELFRVRAAVPALAWLMLASTPRKPRTLLAVVPQLSWAVDRIPKKNPELRRRMAERLEVWVFASVGVYHDAATSLFEIADGHLIRDGDAPLPDPVKAQVGLVVMRREDTTPFLPSQAQFKALVDVTLPLFEVRDIAAMRTTLLAEYPHAPREIGLLLRDLRDGKPVRIAPILIVGPPGSGKSRIARRFAELCGPAGGPGLPVYRVDAAGASDNMFSGNPKAWGGTQASVPVRAIAALRVANPLLLIDELDKSASGTTNGRLWDCLVSFTDRETSSRYRDVSIDAQVDCSFVNYISTANDDTHLPEPLRDRWRIIRMPQPRPEHLPALARQVLLDQARADDVDPAWLPQLAPDELAVIAKAWTRSRFSLRKLQKIVAATVDAREKFAMRH